LPHFKSDRIDPATFVESTQPKKHPQNSAGDDDSAADHTAKTTQLVDRFIEAFTSSSTVQSQAKVSPFVDFVVPTTEKVCNLHEKQSKVYSMSTASSVSSNEAEKVEEDVLDSLTHEYENECKMAFTTKPSGEAPSKSH
jgi:hypothetical protein